MQNFNGVKIGICGLHYHPSDPFFLGFFQQSIFLDWKFYFFYHSYIGIMKVGFFPESNLSPKHKPFWQYVSIGQVLLILKILSDNHFKKCLPSGNIAWYTPLQTWRAWRTWKVLLVTMEIWKIHSWDNERPYNRWVTAKQLMGQYTLFSVVPSILQNDLSKG